MAKKLPVGKPKTRWFLPWIRGYQVAWLRPDLLAGVTLTALLLPQAIGYARIANMPPSAALAMVPVSLAVYGCAGGSLHLVVATNSAISLTSAATIAQFDGPPVDLSMALALTAGVILLAAGLLRLGFLADFMARPVMEGFLMGLALIIFVNQLPDLLGVPSEKDGFVATALAFARELPEINPWSALIGVSALGLMFGLSKALPRFPGSLIAVVLGIVAVRLFGLEDLGVRTVGDLPPMDLNPRLPSVDGKTLVAMAPAALGIAVIALGESISAGRKIAAKHDRSPPAEKCAAWASPTSPRDSWEDSPCRAASPRPRSTRQRAPRHRFRSSRRRSSSWRWPISPPRPSSPCPSPSSPR